MMWPFSKKEYKPKEHKIDPYAHWDTCFLECTYRDYGYAGQSVKEAKAHSQVKFSGRWVKANDTTLFEIVIKKDSMYGEPPTYTVKWVSKDLLVFPQGEEK